MRQQAAILTYIFNISFYLCLSIIYLFIFVFISLFMFKELFTLSSFLLFLYFMLIYFVDIIIYIYLCIDNNIYLLNFTFMEKLSRGLRNNNPFNIKRSHIKFNGEISDSLNTDSVFKQFSTRALGIRAGLVILHTYMSVYHLYTVCDIISRFAPANENATVTYWSFVSRNMHVDPFKNIDCNVANLAALGYWICQYENGKSCPICLNDFIDCIKKYISL